MKHVRKDEPDYAFIPDVDVKGVNQWGNEIQTVPENHKLTGKSLKINFDTSIGENRNRYKQHGFHFTADNCIGCHACEAACSEKNDLPAHISFRSVGYLEGGSYPSYKRLNISMACNHCDNPVCLKGCPTRAYTKYAEYGAVLQDPDICFGCGYCTWVCPYNAPQLDPVKGQVSKCNMCVDRLEEGLKPACAAACLGGALDFGVIESSPQNRDQTKTRIPGFPTPDITYPNIRFQQTRTLPRKLNRTDSMPIHYHREEDNHGVYQSKAANSGQAKQWNLKKLRSREDPLVIFTLITQAVVGAFILLFLGQKAGDSWQVLKNFELPLLFTMIAMQVYALFTSTMHLGKPHRFYRAFNNLRHSPVSREVAAIAVFFNIVLLYTLLTTTSVYGWIPDSITQWSLSVLGWVGSITGCLAVYAMHKIYRIKARPYWNHWQVLTSFFGSVLSLGGLLLALSLLIVSLIGISDMALMPSLAWLILAGVIMECMGLIAHKRYLARAGGEASAAMHKQDGEFGYTYMIRNIGLFCTGLIALAMVGVSFSYLEMIVVLGGLTILLLGSQLLGRALFYVLVIPTTMPGAFFWKNKGFQEHAIETGLAELPQVGVVPQH